MAKWWIILFVLVLRSVNACRRNTSPNATPHIRCLNLVPCKFEIFKSYRVSWNVVLQSPGIFSPESGSGFDQQLQSVKCQHQEHEELSGTSQKALSLQSAWVLSTTCVSLMALHSLGHFRRGRVLPRGVGHHVIVVFFSDPSIFPHLVCGRVWLMALWQRWSIIQH